MRKYHDLEGIREDSKCWYGTLSSERIELAFPKSPEFISSLPQEDVRMLENRGWPFHRTVFLRIPFFLTFIPYEPAPASSWMVDIQEKLVYFQVLVFQTDYLHETTEIDLLDTILHEEWHIRENSKRAKSGGFFPGRNEAEGNTINERRREELEERDKTFRILAGKFGEEKVMEGLEEAHRIIRKKLRVTPILADSVMEYWFRKYMISYYDTYRKSAYALPAFMRGGKWADAWNNINENVEHMYKFYFNIELQEQ